MKYEVNKVIRAEKQNLFDGNTVLAPVFEPWKKSKEYDELKKSKDKLLADKKQIRIKAKAKILVAILAFTFVGFVIIFRYSEIFDMQKALVDQSRIVTKAQLSNENIGIQLAKLTDISHVEDVAINKLHMVKAEKGKATFIDLSKNNFPHTAVAQESNKNGIIEKIKAFLF